MCACAPLRFKQASSMERERSRFMCDSILHVVAVIVSILPLLHWSLRRHCSCFLFDRCKRRHGRLGGALPFERQKTFAFRSCSSLLFPAAHYIRDVSWQRFNSIERIPAIMTALEAGSWKQTTLPLSSKLPKSRPAQYGPAYLAFLALPHVLNTMATTSCTPS
ncbi:hypothetical protein FA10DRAFT_68276 [Acaromyces ingoldii]|uniref:Uncharacterized protein n=1 Tax=Acaromyces ingoldii TaxID=215250 RepID=A0A316YTX4_9BASI|nr:hypothetical protein FA10DRAFT_68276 [Acaromyces ingoldii]PWN91473.1 hypothetical protein FA10DRAFT_68276 [Acaromyces ingoldii]